MSTEQAIAVFVLHGAIVFFVGMLVGIPYGVLRVRGGNAEARDGWRIAWIAMVMATPGSAAWWEIARPVYTERVARALDDRLKRGGLSDIRDFDMYRLDEGPVV